MTKTDETIMIDFIEKLIKEHDTEFSTHVLDFKDSSKLGWLYDQQEEIWAEGRIQQLERGLEERGCYVELSFDKDKDAAKNEFTLTIQQKL